MSGSRLYDSVAMTDLGRALLALPPQLIAAGVARGCKLIAQESQKKAERILGNVWLDIAPILAERIAALPSSQSASILLLEQYFHHAGDWRAMEERLIREIAATVPAYLLESTLSKIATLLVASARKAP